MTIKSKSSFALQLLGLLSIPLWLYALYCFTSRDNSNGPADSPSAVSAPLGTSDASATSSAASTTSSATDSTAVPSTPASSKPTLPALIDKENNLTDAMRQARLVLGPSDPDFVSAVREAGILCAHGAEATDFNDPSSGLRAGMLDKNKIWAVDRLDVLCDGFDPSKSGADRSAVDSIAWTAPAPELLATSRHVIESSKDRHSLARAGITLIQNDGLPAAQASGLSKLGKKRLTAAWIQATSLATCGTQLGCSANSPLTASYCARVGCPPGTDFRQALAASLPPDDYRAVVSLSDWIRQRRL